MSARPFLFAGGGTGGHIFPLVAVAQALRQHRPECPIVYVGTSRGLESRILGDLGERLEMLDILPIKGGGIRGAIKGVLWAAKSLPASRKLVQQLRPCAVLSIGGYAAGPVSLAARTLGIPLALLEPNSVLGFANLLMAPFAKRAYVAFSETERHFRPSVVRRTGVPLRLGFTPSDYHPADNKLRVLVLGGSQGALTLNQNVPEAIGLARKKTAVQIEVIHQSGRNREPEVLSQYEKAEALTDTSVVPFIDDVAVALSNADVVIQRAGAGAVAEVCAVGRASILIPYPYAAGNHQLHNAQALEQAGAALCVPSSKASPQLLAEQLVRLASDPQGRIQMARAARLHGRPDAANRIALDLLQLAEVA